MTILPGAVQMSDRANRTGRRVKKLYGDVPGITFLT